MNCFHWCLAPFFCNLLKLWISIHNFRLSENFNKTRARVFTFKNDTINQVSDSFSWLWGMLQVLILSVCDDFFGMHVLQNEGAVRHQALDEFHLLLSDHFRSRSLEKTAGFCLSSRKRWGFVSNGSFALGKCYVLLLFLCLGTLLTNFHDWDEVMQRERIVWH